MKLNDPLKIEDVDFRIQSINRGGYASILAYKNARVDMNRLDEIYSPLGWKREHNFLGDSMFCTISVWDDKTSQWVSKQDVGVESFSDKQKGEASDSFKRAGFNWGIGRELYDYPVISIKLNPGTGDKPQYGEWYMDGTKPKAGYGLKLKDWVWNSEFTGGKINYLAAWDDSMQGRFEWGKRNMDRG